MWTNLTHFRHKTIVHPILYITYTRYKTMGDKDKIDPILSSFGITTYYLHIMDI